MEVATAVDVICILETPDFRHRVRLVAHSGRVRVFDLQNQGHARLVHDVAGQVDLGTSELLVELDDGSEWHGTRVLQVAGCGCGGGALARIDVSKWA